MTSIACAKPGSQRFVCGRKAEHGILQHEMKDTISYICSCRFVYGDGTKSAEESNTGDSSGLESAGAGDQNVSHYVPTAQGV